MNTPQNKISNKAKAENYDSPELARSTLQIPATPLLQTLGYGTGIEVYRVQRSPYFGAVRSPWAIKRLTKKNNLPKYSLFNERLNDEANILRSLMHPNIVGFRGMARATDGRTTLVMEDCDRSLGDLLEARFEEGQSLLDAKLITKISIDISKALNYLHTEAFLLHGDIKSHNILIKKNFEICKLCDFGVSLPLNKEGYVDLKRKPSAKYTGTDLWSAPEVLVSGQTECISYKADIFSFGLVIYECIALIPPHMDHFNMQEDTVSSDKTSSDSDVDFEDKIDALCGTRPALPEHLLSDDYNTIGEIFYLCTREDPEERPNAAFLLDTLQKTG